MAGAYAIERLTDDIERGAEELLARIERAGGTLAAIEAGLIQREIQESAYRAQLAIDAGAAKVVGVNVHQGSGASEPDQGSGPPSAAVFTVEPDLERRQIERVRALRATRRAQACRAALDEVSRAAAGSANLVPPIIAAVEAAATVGEIADAMRAVFGEYEETATI
jgi:methylmalonyl-CoA mutase N-terminal domain/subunit